MTPRCQYESYTHCIQIVSVESRHLHSARDGRSDVRRWRDERVVGPPCAHATNRESELENSARTLWYVRIGSRIAIGCSVEEVVRIYAYLLAFDWASRRTRSIGGAH